MTQFKAKFDFESQGPDELGFSVGEILTVLDTSVPGGWWKAQNSAGQEGFIPSDFVEVLESDNDSVPEPSFAPPPLPVHEEPVSFGSYTAPVTATQSAGWYTATDGYSGQAQDDWSTYNSQQESNTQTQRATIAPQTSGWDSDEFDDDDEVPSAKTSVSQPSTSVSSNRIISPSPSSQSVPNKSDSTSNPPARPVPSSAPKSAASSGVFMKLSDYAKTGVGAFVLGQTKHANPPPSEAVQIYVSEGVVQWRGRSGGEPGYDILPGHKVGGKLGGLKKFVEYTIAHRNSRTEVQRRFKQFDWLHEQLRNKFVVIAIPPLPHKQLTGRYEEDFIEVRKRGLQAWLSRIARHPVVAHSNVFQHFVSCTDLKDKWKQGKRMAEKDEWQGGRWLMAIECPSSKDLSGINDREEVRQFEEYSETLSTAVKGMIETQQMYSKKQACVYKRDYQKISQSFAELANAFKLSPSSGLQTLARSTNQSAAVFEDISKLFGDQPDLDALPFIDALFEYKGILSDGLPEMLSLGRSAAASLADVEKQGNENKMSPEDVEACRNRARTLNLAILAERTYLCRQQEADFEQMFCQFIRAQIMFYSNVTRKLEEALRLFPNGR